MSTPCRAKASVTTSFPGVAAAAMPSSMLGSTLAKSGVSTLFLLALCAALPARADTDSQKHFEIASEPLVKALNEFRAQSGVSVAAPRVLITGKEGAAVRGFLAPTDALAHLLQGSDLTFDRASDGRISIQEIANNDAPQLVLAQAATTQSATSSAPVLTEVTVTGSRIRQAPSDLTTPISVINPETISDNGYVQVGQALNDNPSMIPSVPTYNCCNSSNYGSDGTASPQGSGPGFQYPNLFGLGAGRTLSLVDGLRIVTTAQGLGDPGVDTNIMPLGLIDRVDVALGSGAAVYGSDAIAGVVNYVLKDHFTGVQVDAQRSETSYGDYPVSSLRVTMGTDFSDGRGNIATDIEWSKSDPLLTQDRPNDANTGWYAQPLENGGFQVIQQANFWEFNKNGVIFDQPDPVSFFLTGGGLQFNPSGAVVPYNPGNIAGIPFASGGQGYPLSSLGALISGVQRKVANVLGHYDLTDHLKASVMLLWARTDGTDPIANYPGFDAFGSTDPTQGGALTFTNSNPYLTPSAIAALNAASPTFAAGGPLYLSETNPDFLSTTQAVTETQVYSALFKLSGDFDALNRNYYWSASFSRGLVQGTDYTPAFNNQNLLEALDPVLNSNGQIVCAVNNPVVTVAGCAPIDPFGPGNVSKAAQAWVTTLDGESYENTQNDLVMTLGGSIVHMPAGDLKFSVGYEHRADVAEYVPSPATQLGLTGAGIPTPAESGQYHTNEFSGELLAPILGKNFSLPGVQSLDLNAAFRHVENSVTNAENVYELGLRWQVVPDVAFRASISRNFRAPTLNDLFSPTVTGPGSSEDPCDPRGITSGPNPTVQYNNCLALFQQHPTWGLSGTNTLQPGASAAARLANFVDAAWNNSTAEITSGGNADLQNEVSRTVEFGVVLQPRFIEGLTLTADRIQINISNGLTQFDSYEFLTECLSSAVEPAQFCDAVTRDPATGNIATGVTEYVNASEVRFHGEVYNLDYNFPLSKTHDYGRIAMSAAVTHTSLADTDVLGIDTITSGTETQPNWVSLFNLRYGYHGWGMAYQAVFRNRTAYFQGANYTNTPDPMISSNLIQNVSFSYRFLDQYQVRFGINNFANRLVSYPTSTYGDVIGRTFFIDLNANF